MNKRKTLFIIIITLLILIILYFYIQPLTKTRLDRILKHRITDIVYARNYYSVLASFLTMITGFTGLLLGLIYFTKRIEIENRREKLDKKSKMIEFVKDKINIYDDLVDYIICGYFQSSEDLKKTRDRIERSFDEIRLLLEENEKFLGLSTTDVIEIINIDSFVEKNDLIMRENFDNIDKNELKSFRFEFADVINTARSTCYKNIFEIKDTNHTLFS